ncbi:MAG: TlpA disulfide reductase family protein [Pseudomonadota bacterium]
MKYYILIILASLLLCTETFTKVTHIVNLEKKVASTNDIISIKDDYLKLAEHYLFEGQIDKGLEMLKKLLSKYPKIKGHSEIRKLFNRFDLQKPNKKAPMFSQKTIDKSKTVKLSDFKGKLVLIDFWATWCLTCMSEIEKKKVLFKKYEKNKDFVYIGVCLNKEKNIEYAMKLIKDKQIPWLNIHYQRGDSSKIAVDYGITQLPWKYLIDKNGIIIKSKIKLKDLDQLIGKNI